MNELIEYIELDEPSGELMTDAELDKHKRMFWEHYRRFFTSTKHYDYFVNSRGYIEKYNKKFLTEEGHKSVYFERVPMKMYQRNKKGRKERYLSVVIDHKRYAVKTLVAQSFSRTWVKGSRIYHNNRKPSNCNYLNLIIVGPNERINFEHKGQEIEVLINKKWVRFNSIKEAAHKLNVSISSFRRYIHGQIKNKNKSVSKDIRFRFVGE